MKYRHYPWLLSSLILSPTSFSQSDTDAEQVKELETMVVTSQRLQRPWRELASNMNYLDESDIERLALQDLDQVLSTVPNVTLQALAGDYNYIQMRGMPRNLEQATVGVYIDGIPYNNLYELNPSLLNIKSIEVIRGPQANLFGRNVRDGVIAITTAEPDLQAQGKVSLSWAELNQQQLTAHYSTPLTQALSSQISVNWIERDGTVKNTNLNNDLDPLKQIQVNNTWHWQASDAVKLKLILNHTDKKSGAYPYVNGAIPYSNSDELTADNNVNNDFNQKNDNATIQVDWLWSADWLFSAIANYANGTVDARFDADFSALDMGYVDTWLEQRDSYYEFRLASQNNPSLSWLFGLSYSLNRDANRTQTLTKIPYGDTLIEATLDTQGQLEQTSYVAYADATWKVSEHWQIQGGVRYLDEQFSGQHQFNNPLYPMPAANTQGQQQVTDSEILKKFAVNYLVDDHHSFFVGYGEGYLSGGATWIAEQTDAQLMRTGIGVPYAPELSDTAELGYKYQAPKQGVFADVTLFYSALENYQHAYADAYGLNRIASVKQVNSQGAEFNLRQQLNQWWQWAVSFGVNSSEIDAIDGFSGATTKVAVGTRLPNTAKNTGHISINYKNDIAQQWQMDATLSVDHSGETLFDLAGETKQEAYQLMNLNMVFQHDSDWRLSVFAKNLLDKRYQQVRVQYPGIDIANYGMPRQVGIAVTKSF